MIRKFPAKKLQLKKETLGKLNADQLAHVAGGTIGNFETFICPNLSTLVLNTDGHSIRLETRPVPLPPATGWIPTWP